MTKNLSGNSTDNRMRNILLALTVVVLSVAFFFGLQTQSNSSSLEAQAQQATPLDVAIAEDKPALLEFYADWCTSCQAMSQELAELKQEYADSVNFVMLNVDNTKWLPEILRYQVDGIPHFVFLDRQGEPVAENIGEQPKSVLKADLEALIASQPLPYTYSSGQASDFAAPASGSNSKEVTPRSHGG